jgi:cytochrome c-type biogenesis protein CcmH/NrfF
MLKLRQTIDSTLGSSIGSSMRLIANLPLRVLFLVALMGVAIFAQTGADLESAEVLRVGAKLKCKCGCNQSMACQMAGGCGQCKINRTKIYQMQHSGMSDQQIVDRFVAENGPEIVIIPPGTGGLLGPYVALGLGMIVVLLTIRRYMAKKPAVAGAVAGTSEAASGIDPATLAQIEKEMDKFD